MTTRDFHKAQSDHMAAILSRVSQETRAKRAIKTLNQLIDETSNRQAADCFDTALEATEEGLAILRGRKA